MLATNQTVDSIHLERSSNSASVTDASEEKMAGVGMHIILDETCNPPLVKILNIAEWSPLESRVLPGDTLESIDRIPCNTLTFEQASGMIVGRPGDNITLQFSRPGSSKPKPWRITLPRVLPRHTVQISQTNKVSAPVHAPISKIVHVPGTSPMIIGGPEVGARVVITSSEIWNPQYGNQDRVETDFKNLMIDDVSKASGISSMRLNIYRLETDSLGLRVHMAIYTSPAPGSGIRGIDPASSKEVALNLIAQGADKRSKLRSIRPAIVKVEFEGESKSSIRDLSGGIPEMPELSVPASTTMDTDLIRNVMTEFETLTLFIQANHDQNLLYQYSRVARQITCPTVQGDKVKPPYVLKPYEAADRLKRAYLQVQEEFEEFKRVHHMPYEALNRVVKERDGIAEERDNLYHEIKLLRAEVGELRAMRELFDVEKTELLERYEMEKKLIRDYMKIEDQSLEQAKATVEHQQKCIQTLQDYIGKWQGRNGAVLMCCPGTGLREFPFNAVLCDGSTLDEMYESAPRQMVIDFVNGQNASIFALGQTGSGKTHIMFGPNRETGADVCTTEAEGSLSARGIAHLACTDVQRFITAQHTQGITTILRVSYVEIYGEQVTDLLNENAKVDLMSGRNGKKKATEAGEWQGVVHAAMYRGKCAMEVKSNEHLSELLLQGDDAKRRAATMNQRSSRAHCLLMLSLSRQIGGAHAVESYLVMADLGGSEQVFQSKVSSLRGYLQAQEFAPPQLTHATYRQDQEVNTGKMPSIPPLPPIHWDEAKFVSKLQEQFAGKVSPSRRPDYGVPNYGSSTYTSTSPPQSNKQYHNTSRERRTDRTVESSAAVLYEKDRAGHLMDECPLPPGWAVEEYDGQRLYVDHNTRRFSHVHPLELPGNEEGQ